jgi:hypothetical protein
MEVAPMTFVANVVAVQLVLLTDSFFDTSVKAASTSGNGVCLKPAHRAALS